MLKKPGEDGSADEPDGKTLVILVEISPIANGQLQFPGGALLADQSMVDVRNFNRASCKILSDLSGIDE
ncbi:MAG: hypothetical protein HY665_08175 [Chloroflexi bacterium]|nr:hypothetical protein [Chloroflexota bacterium]